MPWWDAGAMLPRCCFSVLLFSGTRGKAQTPCLRSQEGELAARLCSAFPENRLVLMHSDSNHHIRCPDQRSLGKCLCPSCGPQSVQGTGENTRAHKTPLILLGLFLFFNSGLCTAWSHPPWQEVGYFCES